MQELLFRMMIVSLVLSVSVLGGCPSDDDDDSSDDDAADDDAGDDDAADDDAADDDVADDDAGDDDTGIEFISIELASLTTSVQFFTFDAGGTTVQYFAVLGSDGDPHVAFDACDQCYSAGLGYRQEGDQVICNNCSNSFAINSIGTKNQPGGCWPGYIEFTVDSGQILIDPAVLAAGAWYFA